MTEKEKTVDEINDAYGAEDLQKAFLLGTKSWLMRNAGYFFIFFGLGVCVGFLLAINLAKGTCGA